MPDKLREMQELFLVEAAKYNVFPLDNSVLPRLIAPRPSATAGRTVFTYSGEMSGIPAERCTEHPEQGPTPSPPRWRSRRAAARE